MRINRIIHFTLAITATLAMMSACEEEGSSPEESFEQEQRFFNIYLAANYPDAEPQTSGLYYQEHTAGAGATPGLEDWVLVNYVAYVLPDDQVYETYIESVVKYLNQDDPEVMYGPYKMFNGANVEGVKEGISMMREGTEATVLFTSDLGHGSTNTGSVGAYRSLKYEIELLEVIGDMDNMDAYEQGKIDNYLDTVAQYDTVYDANTEKAISYIVDIATEGPLVGLDSTISVAYKGYLLDGRVFDEKTSDDPFIFIPNSVEWGARWDLILPRLHEGEKVRMIFPYQLAYGEIGEYTSGQKVKIPPFETLIFDLEVISVEAELPEDPSAPE